MVSAETLAARQNDTVANKFTAPNVFIGCRVSFCRAANVSNVQEPLFLLLCAEPKDFVKIFQNDKVI